MSNPNDQWRAPDQPNVGAGSSPPQISYGNGAPLGGALPVPGIDKLPADRRDLILTTILLASAIVAGASSLMPWRDYAWQFSERVEETGWVRSDGSLGRGWITVAIAVLVAVGGVLIAAERTRSGRFIALFSGIALMAASIIEWGVGDGGSRNGPGLGLWVELAVGAIVVLAIGMLEPSGTPRRSPVD